AFRRRPRQVVPEAARHLGAHEARADREDEHVLRRELPGQELREAVHSRLARAVGRRATARRGQIRGTARDVDDAAAAALDHSRRERVAATVDAEDVHLERPPPVVRVGERILGAADARIAHEHVELAALAGPARHVVARRYVADERTAANLGRDAFDLLPRAAGDIHGVAVFRECARDALADPAPTAGHQRIEWRLSQSPYRSPRAT